MRPPSPSVNPRHGTFGQSKARKPLHAPPQERSRRTPRTPFLLERIAGRGCSSTDPCLDRKAPNPDHTQPVSLPRHRSDAFHPDPFERKSKLPTDRLLVTSSPSTDPPIATRSANAWASSSVIGARLFRGAAITAARCGGRTVTGGDPFLGGQEDASGSPDSAEAKCGSVRVADSPR